MKEHWLEVLEWIQLAITLAFLVVMAGILALVIRYHKLEFNGLWKTRAFMVAVCIMWAFSLLLGRQQLWSPNDGLLNTNNDRYEDLCRAHVFLTFGLWQPLFFLTILMILRAKERSKLVLYLDEPNKYIVYNSLLWCIPIFVVHIIIIALGAIKESNAIVWATYTSKYHHCVTPILSTTASAAFYCCFILFYIMSSRKLFTRLLNHNLRNRIRITQACFVFFFPLEIVVRFIMIFISKYEKPFEALYHTYFFIDLIVCSVAVLELVLLPVIEAASYPLTKGVIAQACKDYEKQEGVRRQRKSTRNIPPIQRVMSLEGVDVDKVKEKEKEKEKEREKAKEKEREKDFKHVEMKETKGDIMEEGPVTLKHSPSARHAGGGPSSIKRTPSIKGVGREGAESDSKPILHHTSSSESELGNADELRASLHVKLPPPAPYPTDLEDIFADIDNLDDEGPLDDNNSLKLKLDGVSFHEDA